MSTLWRRRWVLCTHTLTHWHASLAENDWSAFRHSDNDLMRNKIGSLLREFTRHIRRDSTSNRLDKCMPPQPHMSAYASTLISFQRMCASAIKTWFLSNKLISQSFIGQITLEHFWFVPKFFGVDMRSALVCRVHALHRATFGVCVNERYAFSLISICSVRTSQNVLGIKRFGPLAFGIWNDEVKIQNDSTASAQFVGFSAFISFGLFLVLSRIRERINHLHSTLMMNTNDAFHSLTLAQLNRTVVLHRSGCRRRVPLFNSIILSSSIFSFAVPSSWPWRRNQTKWKWLLILWPKKNMLEFTKSYFFFSPFDRSFHYRRSLRNQNMYAVMWCSQS